MIFGYGYVEDLLALITFAKNFGFLAGVVSQIIAIENSLQSKNQFFRNAFEMSYLLRHFTITIEHKNLIPEIGYTCANSVFLPSSSQHFTKFFQW